MTHYYPGITLYNYGVQMLHAASIGGMNDDSDIGMPTWKDIYVRR